jgi:hypothetical protein
MGFQNECDSVELQRRVRLLLMKNPSDLRRELTNEVDPDSDRDLGDDRLEALSLPTWVPRLSVRRDRAPGKCT